MNRTILAGLAAALLALPAAAQTPPPAPAPTATTVPPAKMAAPMTPSAAPASAAPAALESGQFATDAAAKAKCPADTVVWVNNKSHKYFMSDARYYGKTKRGGYMCQKDADAAGDKQAGSLKKKKDTTAKS